MKKRGVCLITNKYTKKFNSYNRLLKSFIEEDSKKKDNLLFKFYTIEEVFSTNRTKEKNDEEEFLKIKIFYEDGEPISFHNFFIDYMLFYTRIRSKITPKKQYHSHLKLYFRFPKTTQEKRRACGDEKECKQFNIKLRSKRNYNNLPDAYDDKIAMKKYKKSWKFKSKAKSQWKNI